MRRLRQEAPPDGDRIGGERRERGATVLHTKAAAIEIAQHLVVEGVAVQRLGRQGGEIGMRHPPLDQHLVRRAARRDAAAAIEAHAGPLLQPVVDQRIARPGVEGDQAAVLADPGHVGDSADIEHRDRTRNPGSDRRVHDRRQRRPLPSRGDVGGAEVGDDVDPGGLGEPRRVADLPGSALFRRVQQRMAVEADQIDRPRRAPRLVEQRPHCPDMGLGQRLLDAGDLGMRLAPADH